MAIKIHTHKFDECCIGEYDSHTYMFTPNENYNRVVDAFDVESVLDFTHIRISRTIHGDRAYVYFDCSICPMERTIYFKFK